MHSVAAWGQPDDRHRASLAHRSALFALRSGCCMVCVRALQTGVRLGHGEHLASRVAARLGVFRQSSMLRVCCRPRQLNARIPTKAKRPLAAQSAGRAVHCSVRGSLHAFSGSWPLFLPHAKRPSNPGSEYAQNPQFADSRQAGIRSTALGGAHVCLRHDSLRLLPLGHARMMVVFDVAAPLAAGERLTRSSTSQHHRY